MTNRLGNISRTGARSSAPLFAFGLHGVTAATLIASTVTTPSAAQGEYVRELPPGFTEPAGGPPTPACVNRLRSLGSPVEFSLVNEKKASDPPFAAGRLFRAGPGQPYSNLAESGRSVTVYLDGFVCLEEASRHWISAFKTQCRGDQLVGSDGTGVWVLSVRSGSPRSN